MPAGADILRWTTFISINDSLTLDSLRKLDSNRCDSAVAGALPDTSVQQDSVGV
jgi:hypothetical protein